MERKFVHNSNRIFCICGHLEDMICCNDMHKLKFNQYFSEFLKNAAGVDTIVYYLSARGMRTYDKESAKKLIALNQNDNMNDGFDNDFDDGDFEGGFEDEELVFTKEIPDSGTDNDCTYSARLEYEDFIKLMEQLLNDSSHKNAVVFESIVDYIQANEACDFQHNATLHYMLSDALDDNGNMVIFMAINQDYNQIYSHVSNNDILRSAFFIETGSQISIKNDHFLEVGNPKKDEIMNLMEHYRIYGNGHHKYLDYKVADLRKLGYLFEKYAHIDGAASLNSINTRLLKYMEKQKSRCVKFDQHALETMYPSIEPLKTPIDALKEMNHVSSVVRRLHTLQIIKEKETETAQKSIYELRRFFDKKFSGNDGCSRFLLKGYQKTNRSRIAEQMAAFLYYVDEVSCGECLFLRQEFLRSLTIGNMEEQIHTAAEAAKEKIMILDDLDILAEPQDAKALIEEFQRCFVQELSYNRNLHFIFIVNTSKAEELFPYGTEVFGIPRCNILELETLLPEDTGSHSADVQFKLGSR